MFGSDKNNGTSQKRPAATKDGGVTILTAGCHFSGKLYCKGATRIGGTIEGEVIAEGLLIVEEDAVINATVKADEIVVHGRVEGQLSVQRKIEMCSTADVQADVATPNLIVHEGALFNGRTSMKRAAVVGEAGTRGGKHAKDAKSRQVDLPEIDPVSDHTTGIAARTPDISFA
jgi:cytoskeletal protein CcmA (bactofilin family)